MGETIKEDHTPYETSQLGESDLIMAVIDLDLVNTWLNGVSSSAKFQNKK